MSEVQVSQDFQTRLFEKIKTDIGSLMSDEECKKLVESAIERIWFTPTTKGDYYNRTTEAPKLLQVVTAAVGPMVQKAAQDWINAHPEEVAAALDKALRDGMSGAVLRAFDDMFKSTFQQMQFGLQSTLQNALQNR